MTFINIISILLIAVCIVLILRIIIKKFPVLAVMDVENIPGQKEAKFKEQIVKERLQREFIKRSSLVYRVLKFGYDYINKLFKLGYDNLYKLKEKYKSEKRVKICDRQDKINQLILRFQEMKQTENTKEAEKALIEIIGIDDSYITAFINLGELYSEGKKYKEAKETFKYALQLSQKQGKAPEQAEISYNLSVVSKEEDNFDEAIEMIRQALDLVSNNPRYIDMLLDLCILKKDKILALDAFDKLTKVNPENQKLEEFRNRIRDL